MENSKVIKDLENKLEGKSDKVKTLFKDKIKELKENNTVLK